MTVQKIVNNTKKNESTYLQNGKNELVLWFVKTSSRVKEFIFEVNGEFVYQCRKDKTAERKVYEFINNGFKVL